ncbi:MAG: GTP cyclohydrolase II RibA [Rubrivivax sp.]|nr:GTP cyclohydrolase II RibA [Rubrivivax sp.]
MKRDPSLSARKSLAAALPCVAPGNDGWLALQSLLGNAGPATAPRRAAAVRLDRCGAELRRGRPLVLATAQGGLLVAAVETLSQAMWQRLMRIDTSTRLLLSADRLQALEERHGAGTDEPARGPDGAPQAPAPLPLPPDITFAQLQQLAAVTSGPGDAAALGAPQAATDETPAWSAALTLCKQSRLIPALLLVALPPGSETALEASQVLRFDPADVSLASPGRAAALYRVSDARVPLAAEENCTLVLFRELDGDAEHVAIIVGQPPSDAPVPVRLHSACLTGDLLGSLRCDCGPQLQRAVALLAQTGGVLLYLAQEGRGTGLANKLRAYRLQDSGLNTLEADRYLGFREDERDFAAAAAMLQALGHTRIQLLTNNPQKIEALRQAGIEVVDRLALHGGMNTHNERYIRTKQQAGHLAGDD